MRKRIAATAVLSFVMFVFGQTSLLLASATPTLTTADVQQFQKPAEEEGTFKRIIRQIRQNSTPLNIKGDAVITPTAGCIAEEGSRFDVGFILKDQINFEFGNPEVPDGIVHMKTGEARLAVDLDIQIGKNCVYNIDGQFLYVDKGGTVIYNSANDQPVKGNLRLTFTNNITGRFLDFKMDSIKAKFYKVQKGAHSEEYVFEGVCVANQLLADINDVESWQRLKRCQIMFVDGQFKIGIKSERESPFPTSPRR